MILTERHPPQTVGRFKEFLFLFLPILVMTFSNFFYLFVEKLMLANLSTLAMEAAVNAAYVCQIFQAPCIAISLMTLVYIGRWRGALEFKAIGPGIWQFIWFAFLSMLITLPSSLIYGDYYFKDTAIGEIVMPYYHFLIAINFIFPLGVTLSCLYVGQGRTRLVLWVTLGSQVVKIILAYLLIFGWGWIPSFGIIGGALSTLIAQSGFCIILLWIFLSPKNANIYDSRSWRFRPTLFWECIHPGLLRAGNRILSVTCWASIAHLMTAKGGDYILILSIGGTLFIFLPFLSDAISQTQITVVSQILGARNYHLLGKAFRSGSLLALFIITLFGIPLLLFPTMTLQYLFPKISLSEVITSKVLLGVWVSFTFFTFTVIPMSYILAYKDTKFSLFMGFVGWINGYLLMYFAIEIMDIAADQFWLVLSLMHGSTAMIYLWRMKWLVSKELFVPLQKLRT